MPHSIEKLAEDILTALADLEQFTRGQIYDNFTENRLLQAAVEREIEIIGEALVRIRNLDQVLFETIPDGHRIIGMRNIIAHGYDSIDTAIVWHAATTHAPQLKPAIQALR
ncbi:HepT-like ribonuclease domain-containing protein [Cerasicoccus frondis]|uniref:HepT-like ribonuclease domain-containing protein n=1 Tax=Cerasicoccus frondis TaxID=490090 RepID=UPI0028529479|nr:HepT-like ribonuclease domain-containing protein [Cerasicoccus frondis]